jgi:predicted amidohydrolase
MRIGLVQMPVTARSDENLRCAAEGVARCARAGARVVCLPEMFLCPYENAAFVAHAEPHGGRTWQALAEMARKNAVTLVGGSFPERDGDRIFNTSFVFASDGRQIARHRKVHLFDIAVAGGQVFRESDTFTAGDAVTVFDVDGALCGLIICFDIRFPELTRLTTLQGAEVVFVPAAFNMTTGPAHWQLSFRARALDNQLYMAGVSPARDARASYVAYGHSIIATPWGDVLEEAGPGPAIIVREIDLAAVARVRAQLPLLSARRRDLY